MGCKVCGVDSRGGYIMIFEEISLKGAFVVEPEKITDYRGFFARMFEKDQFEKMGLDTDLFQSSISFNKKKGTLSGMHCQIKPY